MAQCFTIHADNPQPRFISQVGDILRQGGVIVYPTDACYALGCQLNNKNALERMLRIRALDLKHHLTLMCSDLSQLSKYVHVDNNQFRLLKTAIPESYTFILEATKEVPSRVLHPKRKTIGVRISDNAITQALLTNLGEPLLSCTLLLPENNEPLTDPYDIRTHLEHQVDLVIDGGWCGLEPTTVIDITDEPVLIRQGKGNTALFNF